MCAIQCRPSWLMCHEGSQSACPAIKATGCALRWHMRHCSALPQIPQMSAAKQSHTSGNRRFRAILHNSLSLKSVYEEWVQIPNSNSEINPSPTFWVLGKILPSK